MKKEDVNYFVVDSFSQRNNWCFDWWIDKFFSAKCIY